MQSRQAQVPTEVLQAAAYPAMASDSAKHPLLAQWSTARVDAVGRIIQGEAAAPGCMWLLPLASQAPSRGGSGTAGCLV